VPSLSPTPVTLGPPADGLAGCRDSGRGTRTHIYGGPQVQGRSCRGRRRIPNDRNISRLRAVLEEILDRVPRAPDPGWIAAELAARGALMPSALTQSQAGNLASGRLGTTTGAVRNALIRIARGTSSQPRLLRKI